MSALDKFRKDIHDALASEIERTQESQSNLFFRKSFSNGAGFVPGSTCEEIAMTAIEHAATARAYRKAGAMIEEAYSRLFSRRTDSDAE